MRKIFTFLLALVTSVGMMNAKVTWKSCNISDLEVHGTYESYSKEGVTLSANANHIIARWESYGDESHDGIMFMTDETGGFTFSNTLGKNFTKIEMTLIGSAGWDIANDDDNLGSGWDIDGEPWEVMKVIWTGKASTVDLLKDVSDFHGENVKRIEFYFEGDSEEPDPTYTVALEAGTVNADKVTLSATSAEECTTVTVTPNEEYVIAAFKATYNTTEELSTSFNAETDAYSFTMPAANVTIEATIALKPVPEGDIFAGFTATAGSGGFDNEGHANLVDNKYISSDWTKWCTNNDHRSVPTGESGDACWWIDFEASEALNLTGYILTTGNDTGNEHGRNPKNWVLKAKLNADDAWTTIATVTDDVTMKNKSFKDYKFFVDQSGPFQYFRFEVFANQGAGVMQLCELRLIGTAASAPANPSGTCGDNLTWEFNTATGALTISGTGEMNNYSWDPDAAPWYAYKDAITSVSFPEGITTIGAYAFVNCDNAAFTTVTIPEGVITLGVNAFYNCDGIREITIPSTVTTIEVGAIYDCKEVNSITSYIASPTNLHGYAIYGYKNTCTLYVPYNSIADYQAADCWKYIPNIAAIPGTEPASSDEHITANEDPKNTGVYYSTFFDSANKYALPTGVEAYVAEVSSNALNLTKIAGEGQTIPADNAVILKSTVAGFTITVSDAAPVSFTATNNLHGVDADTEIASVVSGTCYVLSGNSTDGVGFFVYKAPNQLQAHKAYIDLNGSGMAQAPRSMPFVFNGEQTATGVDNAQGDKVQSTKVIEKGVLYIMYKGTKYNVQGQEVK